MKDFDDIIYKLETNLGQNHSVSPFNALKKKYGGGQQEEEKVAVV